MLEEDDNFLGEGIHLQPFLHQQSRLIACAAYTFNIDCYVHLHDLLCLALKGEVINAIV